MDLHIVKHSKLQPEMILRFFVGIILCLVIASGVLSWFFEIDLMTYITGLSLCPFYTITGIPCPGCGMSRAFLLLGQLKIREALIMNFFSISLLCLMVTYFVIGHIPSWLQNKHFAHISLIAVLIFWVFRIINL
jgi:hypothetical protein